MACHIVGPLTRHTRANGMIRDMACRQVGCGATAVVSDGERAWLHRLPVPADVAPVWGWCELEPGHDGLHFLEGLQSGEQVWWLGWHDGPHTRQLRPLPTCPAEDDPDARGDTAPCVLFLDHPGRHSFSYDVGDLPQPQRPPLLVPADADVGPDDLTESQRRNRTRLRAEGLTVRTYLYLTQLLAQEEVLGERSTRHPFGTTDIPLTNRKPATHGAHATRSPRHGVGTPVP